MPLAKPSRQPSHTRLPPRRKELMQNPSEEALLRAAEAVRYVSSPYHRSPGSPMGAHLSRRAHASLCPPRWNQIEANRVLKLAVREGRVSTEWRNDFPRFAWHLEGEVLYEARLSHQA